MGMSKSKFLAFCQCPKKLWLVVNKPKEAIYDSAATARFVRGNEVGDFAMQYFGAYTDVTEFKKDANGNEVLDLCKMISKTSELMKSDSGVDNICEASFSYNGTYCAVDILHRRSKGGDKFDIYEVKSSTSDDEDKQNKGGRKNVYIDDLACQAYVLMKCGVKVENYYTLVLNSKYVYDGKKDKCGNPKYDLKNLFHKTDLTKEVKKRMKTVARELELAGYVLNSKSEMESNIGTCCNHPYDCAFAEYCKKCNNVPEASVFSIGGVKSFDLYENGVVTYEDFMNHIGKVDNDKYPLQRRQIETEISGSKEIFHNNVKINEFLNSLSTPLYFLDFETVQPVLPIYKESGPYDQIPFQYSLHYLDESDGVLYHKDFLAESDGSDPRRALAERLVNDIPTDTCVIAYNKKFECERIAELASLFPDLHDHLMNICGNIKDLMIPFKNGICYHIAMHGSYSIKAVLPSLFPDDSELDYSNLTSVHNGEDAMTLFPKIKDMSPEEQKQARAALLAYCRLDTLAMVRIWEKLNELVKGCKYKHTEKKIETYGSTFCETISLC